MDESHLRGKGLHHCFIDFKKAFDMLPREHLQRHIEELCVLREYMLEISKIHEKLYVVMGHKISEFSNKVIFVKDAHSH